MGRREPPVIALTDDLWAHDFAHLDELFVHDHTDSNLRSFIDIGLDKEIQQLLTLRLVCKRFRCLSEQQTHRFTLPQRFSMEALPNLLNWLRHSQMSLNRFETTCQSTIADIVLGAMIALQSPIKFVDIFAAQPSLQLLSAFHTLETCALSSLEEETLDLLPLQNLPHLTKINLSSGPFTGLEQLTGLTFLGIKDTDVFSAKDCRFVSSLRCLDLSECTLHGLHQQGLSVCSNLEHLALEYCKLVDSEGIEQLNTRTSAAAYPPCTSKLTSLILRDNVADLQSLSTHWVSCLTSLRSVVFELENFPSSFVDSLLSFTNLTEIEFESLRKAREAPKSKLHSHGLWHRLNALKRLSFANVEVNFSRHSAASLLHLTSLRTLCFEDISPQDSNTFSYLIAVILQLLRVNPQLELTLKQLSLSEMLEHMNV